MNEKRNKGFILGFTPLLCDYILENYEINAVFVEYKLILYEVRI